MASRKQQNEAAPVDGGRDFSDGGVVLYDRSGRELTVHTQIEYTNLVFGEGYSETKPEEPQPEPVVPDGGPTA